MLTDFVPLRTASTTDELRFFNSEAFTMRSRYEGMDVVYIESNFFTRDAGGVIFDQDNWTRIVVHELSHLVAGTTDHDNRYAHSGIGVHPGSRRPRRSTMRTAGPSSRPIARAC